jgi:hypothetical protein
MEDVMGKLLKLMITIGATLLFSVSATAQKGAGEATGIAREPVKPPVITLSGKLLEIRTGPCENTTGKSPIGTHLIVQSEDGTNLNIHLGPENAVDHLVDQLSTGQSVVFEAFRTEQLPDNAYIAKSLLLDDKVINLRDDNLRPSWAYAQGMGMGMGKGRGQGMGKGRGRWGSCW